MEEVADSTSSKQLSGDLKEQKYSQNADHCPPPAQQRELRTRARKRKTATATTNDAADTEALLHITSCGNKTCPQFSRAMVFDLSDDCSNTDNTKHAPTSTSNNISLCRKWRDVNQRGYAPRRIVSALSDILCGKGENSESRDDNALEAVVEILGDLSSYDQINSGDACDLADDIVMVLNGCVDTRAFPRLLAALTALLSSNESASKVSNRLLANNIIGGMLTLLEDLLDGQKKCVDARDSDTTTLVPAAADLIISLCACCDVKRLATFHMYDVIIALEQAGKSVKLACSTQLLRSSRNDCVAKYTSRIVSNVVWPFAKRATYLETACKMIEDYERRLLGSISQSSSVVEEAADNFVHSITAILRNSI
jgi:hypothetical protein